LSGVDFAPSSYREPRSRLPLPVLQWLLQWLHAHAARATGVAKRLGPRVLVADGSTYSMPDTPQLRGHFCLPPVTRPGVGWAGKLMGLPGPGHRR